MHVLECGFKDALAFLSSANIVSKRVSVKAVKTLKTCVPVEFRHNWIRTRAYLVKRGIDHIIIDWLYNHKMLYADQYNNCVFLYGQGAELRGIYKKFRGSRGSLNKLFLIPCNSYPDEIIITECAIDAISYRQLYPNSYVCSVAGNGNHKLINQAIRIAVLYGLSIVSAFDDDLGGEIAHKVLLKLSMLTNIKIIRHLPTNNNNDWNDVLNCDRIVATDKISQSNIVLKD